MDNVNSDNSKMFGAMFDGQDKYVMYLDWLDGLVTATMARGFTEVQAREIVVSMVTTSAKSPETDK